MKKNLKQLELKKLFKEFSFLKIDEEYKLELQNTYGPEFEGAVKKMLAENPNLNSQVNGGQCDSSFNSNNNIETRENRLIGNEIYNPSSETGLELYTGITTDNQNNFFESPKSDLVKKLYRNISTKTHPDKVSNKFLNDLYLKAQVAYNKNDIFTLYLICNDLDIPYEFPTEEISKFRENIKIIKTQNTLVEQSYLWVWIHEEDEIKKKLLILHFITNAYKPPII